MCFQICVCALAYLSLPLSPDQRSSSLAGVSVGSSFPQPPSSSSDLAQCAGMEPELPVTDTCAHSQTRKRVMMTKFGKIRVTVYHKYIWILALYPVTYGYYLLELPTQVHFCRQTHNYLFICTPPQSLLKAFGFVSQTLVLKCKSIHLILKKNIHTNTIVYTSVHISVHQSKI